MSVGVLSGIRQPGHRQSSAGCPVNVCINPDGRSHRANRSISEDDRGPIFVVPRMFADYWLIKTPGMDVRVVPDLADPQAFLDDLLAPFPVPNRSLAIVNPAVLELHRETGNFFVKRNRHTTPLSVFIVGTLCAAPGGIFWPCGLSVFSTERNGPS